MSESDDNPKGLCQNCWEVHQRPTIYTPDALCGTLPFLGLLEYLARLCDREINACGLNTEAGLKAGTAKALLAGAIEELSIPNGKREDVVVADWEMTVAREPVRPGKALSRRRPGAQEKPESPPP